VRRRIITSFPALSIRPAIGSNVMAALVPEGGKAGIQQRALRADSNWIPGQARNDETHAVC
jgi:hypothetical protein